MSTSMPSCVLAVRACVVLCPTIADRDVHSTGRMEEQWQFDEDIIDSPPSSVRRHGSGYSDDAPGDSNNSGFSILAPNSHPVRKRI
jgi:hypothetical protein